MQLDNRHKSWKAGISVTVFTSKELNFYTVSWFQNSSGHFQAEPYSNTHKCRNALKFVTLKNISYKCMY